MNEQILKIFTDACYSCDYEPENVPNEVVEKFALRIIGKCASIYSAIDNGNQVQGTEDYLEALHKTFRS